MGHGWSLDFSPTHFDMFSPPDFYTKVSLKIPYILAAFGRNQYFWIISHFIIFNYPFIILVQQT